MSKFNVQTGSFIYSLSVVPFSGSGDWSFSFTYDTGQDYSLSSPNLQQKVIGENVEAEDMIKTDYGFLISNTGSGFVDFYQNQYLNNMSDVNEYSQINRITGDPGGHESFGQAMSVHDDILVVGAPDAEVDGVTGCGAAFVFYESAIDLEGTTGSGWGQINFIPGTLTSGKFGHSVAVTSDGIDPAFAVSAIGQNDNSGAVYLYQEDGDILNQTITPTGGLISGFGKNIFFREPESVKHLFISYQQDSIDKIDIYKESVQNSFDFGFIKSLETPMLQDESMFGYSEAGSGDFAIIGAPEYGGAGAAFYYKYDQEAGGFQLAQEIVPDNISAGDKFGKTLSFNQGTGVIASDRNNGTIYVYEKSGSIWGNSNELSNFPDVPNECLGGNTEGSRALEMGSDYFLIGSSNSGDVYYYTTGLHFDARDYTGFSFTGNNGKLFDNDGNFLYGYHGNEEINISGNVFEDDHNIFINEIIYNSSCSRDTNIFGSNDINGWSVSGSENLYFYGLEVLEVL